ncbi:MAG: AAA domain-containing protein [Mycoplasma sp.]
MKRAIKEKLLNLVTFNPIDYCIKSNITQKHIDISKYVQKQAFINFMEGETSVLEISAASGLSNLESALKNASSASEFIHILSMNGFNISQARANDLMTNFETTKKKATTFYIDQVKSFKRQFISLNRTANNYYNDSTVWPLYVAYRFVKGRVGVNVSVKAPLIIYKVAVYEEGSKLFIKKLEEQPIVNEKIQIVMNKEYPSIATIEDLLTHNSFADYLDRYEKMTGYKLSVDHENLLINFKNETAKQLEENYERLSIENSALIGIFEPGGGALKEDLKNIIERDVDPFESQIDGDIKSNAFYEEKIIKDPSYIYEIDKPLNIYQKYAVASSMNQSTLIYGPPGTGKSEVIANIICNALIKGKTTLMVSEKKAALEVLTNRISSLSQFALYIYESSNRDSFYKKIDNLNSLLGTQWYRETGRVNKSNNMDPIKFNKDELMFIKNYEDWYEELVKIVKKYWNIEDYNDGIFKLDYNSVQEIRNELGEDLCTEWLQIINIEGFSNVTLLDAFRKVYAASNNIFPNIETFFSEYARFKKFIKKFNLLENKTSDELNKYLRAILIKINTNAKIVEKYLLGGSRLNNLFTDYFDFLNIYNGKQLNEFLQLGTKEKKMFIKTSSQYLSFREKVILKDPKLAELTPQELVAKAKVIENYISKYKKTISSTDWFNFILDNSKKIEKFLNLFNSADSQEVAEVIFAEFVINGNLILLIDESTLNIKEIKLAAKNIPIVLPMFADFADNIEHLDNEYVEEIVRYKNYYKFDNNFLNEMINVSQIFEPECQEIIKEWDWISKPYIKYLYLTPIIPFDLEKIQPLFQLMSSSVSNDQFTKLKVVSMWNNIVKENPMFLELKGINLQDVIQQIRKESIRSASIIEELVFKKHINNLRNFLTRLPREEKEDIANVLRIASSNTKPPIAQFVKRYYGALKKLFPIWVARPDNVADMVPLNYREFDYGIFDEASQISIERAYPLVYRANIKIVSGDDKQLRPSSFFMNKLSQQDFDIDDFDAVESLLERAKVSWWNEFHLKNHYRSECKELIEFSNKFIYENSLEVATKAGVLESGIEIIDVNGTWESVNKHEAEKIIELLVENYQKYNNILVVTFNAKQSWLIENMMLERRNKLPSELIEYLDTNRIIITNLENVQGNEGDLVILSVSYGKNAEGVIRSNFGPLISSGGSNRLNVAITRAKKKMIVVKSLYANQIKVNIQNKNAVIFKKFIEYIDAIKNNLTIDIVEEKITEEENLIDGIIEEKIENIKPIIETNFSSTIVKEIYGELLKTLPSKFKLINDYKVGNKNIDVLVVDKNTNMPVKAILIELWKTNRTIQSMLEDIDRQFFLEDRGYETFRIKQYSWNIDRSRIVTKLRDSITNLGSNPVDYVLWQSDK